MRNSKTELVLKLGIEILMYDRGKWIGQKLVFDIIVSS